MGLYKYDATDMPKSKRITKLVENLYAKMPEIESARARLITESYKQTEDEPIILRRAKAYQHILENIPIIIRDLELVVGSQTLAPRSCQTYPEFSVEWLEKEYETVETRAADPFYIAPETVKELKEANAYWYGKTTSDLATAYMMPETLRSIEHSVFTAGNYFYNGVGHVTVKYDEVLGIGFKGIKEKAKEQLDMLTMEDGGFQDKSAFLHAVIISCDATITYAKRYATLALEEAEKCKDPVRKAELAVIAKNCATVPENGAKSFYEACQSFWFVQQLLQLESSGHSISPGRFDQYMYPYYKEDMDRGVLTREFAQELIDCIWVKLNDLNKCRDAISAEGFAGYSLFQNLIVGGQNEEGIDVTNDLSFMSIQASHHVYLPQPSLSVRVWNGSPHELLVKAARLTRTGIGLPAYYNDEVIIPSLENRGLTLEDAREYSIIGCVEPQKAGKTEGWHDAAFFNMCRPLELVFSNGMDKGEQIGPKTGDVVEFIDFQMFYDAYKTQMNYQIERLVDANNAIDLAHARRCPLPFESAMVDDCIKRGQSVQEGGAIYNFTGPQGFGVANMADSLYVIKRLVYDERKVTLKELKEALATNYGKGLSTEDVADITKQVAGTLTAAGEPVGESEIEVILKTVVAASESEQVKKTGERILELIEQVPKFGNDIDEVDFFARDVAYTYTKPLLRYHNPRGGIFQAGLYPVSANVPLGAQTGATPDGRLAHTPVADGVSPSAGADTNGPTAAANSVAKLDHYIASNGTLFNQKFHPTALSGKNGLDNFVGLIRSYFDQKGSHMQFNVVDRETLIAAQKEPEKYRNLVVRVAGYSALFTTLSRSLQDDIIKRTEQSSYNSTM